MASPTTPSIQPPLGSLLNGDFSRILGYLGLIKGNERGNLGGVVGEPMILGLTVHGLRV